MTILFKYVLREFLKPLFYCMTGFLGIYVIFELFDSFNHIIKSKVSIWQFISFFLGYISPYLQWIIPAALLLATLYTLWNFCRHSEITAMRASGIGFSVIVSPLFATAVAMMVLVTVVNEYYAPTASENAQAFKDADFHTVETDLRENVPYINHAANRSWRINRMDAKHPDLLEGVRISFDRPDGSKQLDITCRKAEYLDGMWWLFYPQYQYFDELNIPIENPHPELATLALRAFPEIQESPEDILLMNKPARYYNIKNLKRHLTNSPNLNDRDIAGLKYDIHARMAIPFSCLIITLFAIPAGVATSRQSVFKGVITAIAMFLGFYASNMACMVLAKNCLLSASLAAWIPNLMFFVIGLILFYRQR